MIIPSIDLLGGKTVQLVGGEEQALDAGDPRPLLERFRRVGDVAVIDLDAARGEGSNADLITELCGTGGCRVGGGIRDLETALRWLDAGAERIVIGTAATPELLSQLPPERVQVALDARHGEVVVEGWRKGTGASVFDRMRELEGLCGSYLVTFVEREGRMQGVDLDLVERTVEAAGAAHVTVAGGVTTADEVAAIDALGADCQVGMALYTGALDLTSAFVAPLRSDRPDGLWPTVVTDEHGVALGLAYSDEASVRAAIDGGVGAYHSRKRGLWIKGQGSGDRQTLLRAAPDCDRDTLRFTVRQEGRGFCHVGTRTCFGDDGGIPDLARLLNARALDAPQGSYTKRLLTEPGLLGAKLCEEARELSEAEDPRDVAWEAADVLYFTLVALARAGVPLEAVEAELDRRSRKVTRRPGNAKPGAEDGA